MTNVAISISVVHEINVSWCRETKIHQHAFSFSSIRDIQEASDSYLGKLLCMLNVTPLYYVRVIIQLSKEYSYTSDSYVFQDRHILRRVMADNTSVHSKDQWSLSTWTIGNHFTCSRTSGDVYNTDGIESWQWGIVFI